jgi:hypothetical protein
MPPSLTPTIADPRAVGTGLRAPSDPAARAWTARRVLATVGAAGPVVFLAVTVLAGLLKSGYDVREQAVSDLAIGAHGWLQTANFFALARG